MQELEQLIQKFWANGTTNEENKHLLQLLEEYQALTAAAAPDTPLQKKDNDPTSVLAPDKAATILHTIHNRLGIETTSEQEKSEPAIVRKIYRRVAVAAAVVMLALSTFLWTGGRHSGGPQMAARSGDTSELVSVTNQHDSAMSLALDDGSVVLLEKNSSLSYYKPFVNDRRDISLKGVALFKVAKDKKRPFTVYAGGIATTALGTRFLVNATDNKKVMVRLLDGKVVIKTVAGANLSMNDVYLAPGEQFSFDKDSRKYTVNKMPDRPAVKSVPLAPVEKPELVFRKEPLGKVFEKVGRLYKVPLSFRKEDMNGLYFTGTFLHSDNLNLVLSTICNVNDLLVTKNGDTIAITRSH